MTASKFCVGDEVRITHTTAFGEEVDAVDTAGDLLAGQTGTVERIRDMQNCQDSCSPFQYFVRLATNSCHSNGCYDFFEYELELANVK